MVKVSIGADRVILEIEGLDKLEALKSRIEILLSHITDVRVDADYAAHPKGLRLLGTHVPGLMTAGVFYHKGKRLFWDVHNPKNAIVIDLQNYQYDQVVIEVRNPTAAAGQIGQIIQEKSLAAGQ